ncbi:glycosyltransferase [Ferruginibacter lapsinanis]|uniref:glycosyltransferase n=1 Tax=Ferruginibacter lapsinanis TaxID=563172 RepID=UPI001E50D05B|nr:glycosyltransferase [Ferruginibacter lapsinanis]UEG48598.1 glycosyltransferase [Ferruginibacter lapsinanis]
MNFNELLAHWHSIVFIIFCIVAFIQIFYYLFFYTRLAFYKAKPKATSQTHPVSVIICARDEAANLAKNLPGSLLQQYRTTHEVIVVDDNSFDDSKYLLEEFKKEFKQLTFVELKQEAKLIPGKKFPLSIGIKTAKYEIVLLTDADCVPASEFWIDKMQETYDDDTEIVLGYGAYIKKHGLLNKLVRWETFHTALQYFSYALAGKPYMGVGRNLSYKKTVFFRHKGFSAHNNIPSGDDDLFINMAATKKNTKINIDKDAFTLSEPVTTWGQWTRQKTRHYSTGKYYKPLHKFLLGLYSLSHFLFFPLLMVSAIFYCWQWALIVFGIRFVIQAVIYLPAMKKLNEKDLYPLFLFFDLWMFFYYLIFAVALIKKPTNTWK